MLLWLIDRYTSTSSPRSRRSWNVSLLQRFLLERVWFAVRVLVLVVVVVLVVVFRFSVAHRRTTGHWESDGTVEPG
jgi:hypothetical protein